MSRKNRIKAALQKVKEIRKEYSKSMAKSPIVIKILSKREKRIKRG